MNKLQRPLETDAGNAGNQTGVPQIEVTPEMLEAGTAVLNQELGCPDVTGSSYKEVVEAVFLAMLSVSAGSGGALKRGC